MNRCRRRNKIVGLCEPGGVMVTEEGQKGEIMLRYFSELFSSNEGDARPVLENLERRVTRSK